MQVQQQPQPVLYNVKSAVEYVSAQTNATTVKCVFPHQCTDGAVVDFVDMRTDRTVAAGRFRISNRLYVSADTGDIQVGAYISDISCQRDSLTLAMQTPVLTPALTPALTAPPAPMPPPMHDIDQQLMVHAAACAHAGNYIDHTDDNVDPSDDEWID